MKPLKLKKFKTALRESGAKETDINTALALKKKIEKLDRIVFPGNHCWVHVSHRSPENEDGDGLACCSLGPFDFYRVFVPNLAKSVKEHGNIISVFMGGNKKVFTFDTILVSIAAHEVRHRVQKRSKPRFFKVKSAKKFDTDVIANIRYLAKILFDEEMSRCRREGRNNDYVQTVAGPSEVDAKIVEMISLHVFNHNHSLEDVALMVKAGT